MTLHIDSDSTYEYQATAERRRVQRTLHSVAALLLLLAYGTVLRAAYEDGLLDMATVRRTAAEITTERFPNADDVLVDDHILSTYQADGTAVTYDDTVMKVLTEKGKRDNKTLTRHFVLPFSKASYTLVHVIKPDGTVIPVDIEAQSRVMVDRGQMGANIYNPNSKVLRVTIPEVAIGDLVRYVAKTELVKPRVPKTFSDYQVLEYTSPIVSFTYTIDGPAALPLRSIALKDEVPGTASYSKREDGDRVVHTWRIRDVPRMYREPNMPPLHTVVQRLLVSTIPDWQYLSRWYWELSEPHYEPTAEMKAKVTELTEGLTEREERLRAIFRFVSQEVRYMGITVEKEAPGYEPHDVKLTFENRHGVCRDKAALLVVMTRLAGFEGFPVLIHNGPKKDEEVPQPFFNHAVAAVSNEDGSYTLMDPTDESTKELFPAYLCNQSYLVARPDGDTLRTSPIIPASENMMHVRTTGQIDAKGNLSGKSMLEFEGINDNAYRGYFSRITPEERRRYFEGVVKGMAAGARLTSIDITPENLMNTDEPLRVAFAFSADRILISDGETSMIPVPRLGNRVGMVNFILGNTGLKKREFPFVNDFACGVEESVHIDLDPAIGRPEAMPSYDPIDTDTLTWTMGLDAGAGVLTGKSSFAIQTVEFSPAQYLDLKRVLKVLEVNAKKRPIFTSADDAETDADSIVLDSVREFRLDDSRNWTLTHRVRRKILTYKAKKDHSELKWNYNPVWEEVELLHASVTSGGNTKEISQQEINLMDAAWVASAPRYPGAKTLVASLPGVEEGSVIEYSVRHTIKDRPFFETRQFFRGLDPVRRKVVRIDAPAELDLEVGVFHNGILGKAGETVIEQSVTPGQNGRRIYEWRAADQPRVKREDGMPPWEAFMPVIVVSTGDWDTYGRRARSMLRRHATGATLVDRLTRDVTATTSAQIDRVRAIRDTVAKRIRHAGPGFGDLPLSATSSAESVLEDGYGYTADVAILLYAMLREAGLKPRFVLASAIPRIQQIEQTMLAYPSIGLFDTVLVAIDVRGLGPVYLNDTNQYGVLGATPHDGHIGLELDSRKPRRILAADNREDYVDTRYVLELTPNGSAHVTKTVTYYGGQFAAKNRQFSEMPPEERRRYHQEALTGLSQGADADGDLVTEFDEYPGVETLAATIPDFAIRNGDFLYFNLMESLSNLLRLRSDTRTNPLYWAGPRRFRIRTHIALPDTFQQGVLLPPSFFWQAPDDAGSVWVGVQWSDEGTLEVIHDVDLRTAILDADVYDELLDVNRRLSHPDGRMVLLKTDGSAPGTKAASGPQSP